MRFVVVPRAWEKFIKRDISPVVCIAGPRCIWFHVCLYSVLIRMAWHLILIFDRPKPPLSFGKQTVSLLTFSVDFQRKLNLSLFIELIVVVVMSLTLARYQTLAKIKVFRNATLVCKLLGKTFLRY